MRSLRLACRISLLAATSALFLFLATVVTIHLRNRILRHRGEELLRDMQSINLRQTTLSDVQPIFHRWRPWGKYEYDGECSQFRCAFNISLSPINTPLNQFLYVHDKAFDLAARLGYHPTGLGARIIVLDGRVWGEAIFFGMETRRYENGERYTELVSGEAISVARTELLSPGTHWDVHPEYEISWPTNRKNEIRFRFTPFADPNDVHRLMALDFSCLTRSTPCLDKKDIMPVALAQVTSWSSLPYPIIPDCKNPDPFLLQRWARDARNVIVAKLAAEKPARGYKPEFHVNERTLILQRTLKAAKPSAGLFPASFWMFDFPEPGIRYSDGDSAIFFLKDDNFDAYSLERCSPLAASDRNLSIVTRGIAQDTRPPGLPDFATDLLSR
jgi:hypothetical protein